MPLVLVGTPDRQPRRPVAARRRGAGRGRRHLLRGHPAHRPAARSTPASPARRSIVVNDHTEVRAIAGVLDRLARGERVAVVTDAGMPGISDPGERLVRAAVDAGHAVEVVPGPSAAITALVASGLPTGRFVFEGFLPRKGSGRDEPPRRAGRRAAHDRALRGAAPAGPHARRPRRARAAPTGGSSIGRELTKLHEELWRGTLADAVAWATADEPRGRARARARRRPTAGRRRRRAASRRRWPTSCDDGASARDAAATVAAGARRAEAPRLRAGRAAARPRLSGYRRRSSSSTRPSRLGLDLLVDQVEHHPGQPGGARLAEVDAVLLAEVDQVAARGRPCARRSRRRRRRRSGRCRGRSSTAGSRPPSR